MEINKRHLKHLERQLSKKNRADKCSEASHNIPR